MPKLYFLFVLEFCDVFGEAIKWKGSGILQLDKLIPELLSFKRTSDISTCTFVSFTFIDSRTKSDTVELQRYSNLPRLLLTNPEKLQQVIPAVIKFGTQCSIVFYPNGLIHKEILETDTNWHLHIPGGVFQSYHFSEEQQLLSNSYWDSPFVRRLCNFLILSRRGSQFEWNLLVPNRFQGVPRYLVVGTVLKNEFNLLTENIRRQHGIFWNKWRDVQGQRLIVAVPPTQSKRTLRLFLDKGIYIYAIVEVAEPVRFLNGTIDVVQTDFSRGFGSKLPNGSWDSYVGKVMTDEVVFTAPFFPHQSHFPYVYFPNAVMYSSVRFLTPLPARTTVSIAFLTDPLDRFIWAALFVGTVVNAAMIYFLTVIFPSHLERLQLSRRSFWRHFGKVFRNTGKLAWVLIDQPIPDSFINTEWAKPGIQWVYLGWLLVVMVIVPLYKSIMISELVEPVYVQPPRTFEQLVNSNFRLNVVLYKSVIATNLPWTKNLKYPVTDYQLDIRGCLKTILKGNNVCLFVLHWLYLLAPNHLVDASGKKLFMISKEAVNSFGSNYCVSQRNPQLKLMLNKITNTIIEGGLNQHWIALEFHQTTLRAVSHKRTNLADLSECMGDKLVDDKVLMYPLLMVACGLLGGTLTCIVEILYHKYRHNKMEKSNAVADCHGDFQDPEFEVIFMTDRARPRPDHY